MAHTTPPPTNYPPHHLPLTLCGRRLLKDAVQDLAWGRRYELVLGALLCLCGDKMREELQKQTQLVELLGGVAERVRQAGSSARQVGVY